MRLHLSYLVFRYSLYFSQSVNDTGTSLYSSSRLTSLLLEQCRVILVA